MISLTKKKLNFKQKSPVFVKDKSHKEKLNFNTENSTNKRGIFPLKIRLIKKKVNFKQKKPVFVKDKFHQEKSQQIKKPFFR